MKSPMYKKYDSVDYFDYEFDYQADFKQFLEEAKKNECQGNLKTEPTEQMGIKGKLDGEKINSRKSWKNSLFSWFKTDKKNKSFVQKSPRNGTIGSELRRGPFSGPVCGNGGGGITGRPRKPTSGPMSPITSLFSSSKRVDDEVPYASLGQLNNAKDVRSYGPVYLVT